MCMTFCRWLQVRPSPTASMIWSTTVGLLTWASIMTRLNLRWRVSGADGTSRAKRSIPAEANCSSPPMGAGPTGSEIVYGSRNCRSLPLRNTSRSRWPIIRLRPANGTKSNTGSSPSFPSIGVPNRLRPWKSCWNSFRIRRPQKA